VITENTVTNNLHEINISVELTSAFVFIKKVSTAAKTNKLKTV